MPAKANTIIVDPLHGSDSLGARESYPFLTLAAALTAAVSGDVVLCLPGTHTLPAPSGPGNYCLTVKDGVRIVGAQRDTTILSRTGLGSAATLVKMGDGSALEDLTLKLTSAVHASFIGVIFTANGSGLLVKATCKNVHVVVDNSAASGGGTSAVTGVYADTDGPATEEFLPFDAPRLDNCTIEVLTIGGGVKRGILVSSNGGSGSCVVEARDCDVAIACTGTASTDAIVVETNHAHAVAILRRCHLLVLHRTDAATWTTEAHLSKTLGTLYYDSSGGAVNANGKGLSLAYGQGQPFTDAPRVMMFSNLGALAAGVTRYLYPGGGVAPSSNEIKLDLAPGNQKRLILGIAVYQRTPPTTGSGDVYTVRISGSDTAITCTAAPGQNYASDFAHSVFVAASGTLSIKVVTDAAQTVAAADVVVEVYYI